MSRKKQKLRSERVGKYGGRVKVFERTRGGALYLGYYERQPNGEHQLVKRSLGYTAEDEFWNNGKKESGWDKAVREAHKLAGSDRQRDDEPKDEPVTLRQVYELYCEVVTPKQSRAVQLAGQRHGKAWLNYLGQQFDVRCLDVHDWETFKRKRLTGEIDDYGRRVEDPAKRRPVTKTTTAKSLRWLRDACKVATQRKLGPTRRLLDKNPTDDLEIPKPDDEARHAYTDDECAALLKAAPEVHDLLPTLLTLAIHTGRRLTALCSLRWSDWKPEAVPEAPNGSLTWRADADKQNRTWEAVPVTREVHEALEAHRRQFPGVGEAWVFPSERNPTKRLDRTVAITLLRRCEELAKVEHKPRRAWHGFRRRWATVRKHKPLKDLAYLGGWSAQDHKALQSLYVRPDPDSTLDALNDVKVLRKVR